MSVDERGGPLAELRSVTVRFRHGFVHHVTAVDSVDLQLRPAETLALVGESGAGKTTLCMALLRALRPSGGRVLFDGRDITDWDERRLRPLRPRMQMVFQDPYASLDPHLTVGAALAEPLRAHGRESGPGRVRAMLADVGLPPEAAARRPHELSGGQRQRVGIARALALEPELLVADEPVSALDASSRAQVARLLVEVRLRRRLATLLVAHDLALAAQLGDRLAVMYAGQLVEEGPTPDLVRAPQHPYTAALLSAASEPDPRRRRRLGVVLRGEPPSPLRPPAGCRFHLRCPIARPVCAHQAPAPRERAPGHRAACHFAGEVPAYWPSAGPGQGGSRSADSC